MKLVATFSTPAEAHLLAARLESSGIAVFLGDETTIQTDWLLSNALGGVKLSVADEDFEAAREIMDSPPVDVGILACPKCGSGDVRVHLLHCECRACGEEFDVPEIRGRAPEPPP